MLTAADFESLPEMVGPVLTAYVDTNPANPRNQRGGAAGTGGRAPAVWVRSQGRKLAARFGPDEGRELMAQAERVAAYLEDTARGAKGTVAFAGAGGDAWRVLPLQVAVEEEIYWGPPALGQLLWLRDEHQPAGVAVVSRSGGRFFLDRMGEIEELPHRPMLLDTSQWRHATLVEGRGHVEDKFEKRKQANYDRFFQDLAVYLEHWVQHDRLQAVALLGSVKAIETVVGALPDALRPRVVGAALQPARARQSEIVRRAEPLLEAWKRVQEAGDVAHALENRTAGDVVTGLDETLAALQEGGVRSVLAAHGLRGKVRRCGACGWVDRRAHGACRACGGSRQTQSLRAVLPELVRANGASIEIVAGDAAEMLLARSQGLAGWRRTSARQAPAA